jgi:hypothetical protein
MTATAHGYPSTVPAERLTMVCYARPAAWLAVIVAVAWVVFARPVGHYVATAALAAAVMVAVVGAAVTAALVFATFMSVRRRRAAAGGCVTCRFRCQHAMTGRPSRLWLVTTANRTPPAPGHSARAGHESGIPARSVSVLLPMPTVRPAVTGTAPRWPDRPVYRVSAPDLVDHDSGEPADHAVRVKHQVRDAVVTRS